MTSDTPTPMEEWAAWLLDRGQSFDPYVQRPMFKELGERIVQMERELAAANARITWCPHMADQNGKQVTCAEYILAERTAREVAERKAAELLSCYEQSMRVNEIISASATAAEQSRDQALERVKGLENVIMRDTEMLSGFRAQLDAARKDAESTRESIARQNDQIATLQAEAFTLSAGQCVIEGGLLGGEGGTQYCSLNHKRVPMVEALFISRIALRAWQNSYAEWSQSRPDIFDRRLPPSTHVRALEAIDAAIAQEQKK